MKDFLSLWGFGEVWGIFPGHAGKIIESRGYHTSTSEPFFCCYTRWAQKPVINEVIISISRVITPGKPIYKAIHGVKHPFIAGDGAILYGSSSFSEL